MRRQRAERAAEAESAQPLVEQETFDEAAGQYYLVQRLWLVVMMVEVQVEVEVEAPTTR